jgi:predicted HicB family RNase H-like nuclease
MNEEIDSFASMFDGPPGEKQREARKARMKAERRTQLTEKQRKRGDGGVRTTQINFRCSPAFRELAAGMAKQLGCSIADVMEQALELLASEKGRGEQA